MLMISKNVDGADLRRALQEPPHRYGCHNRPRPTAKSSYVAQKGWYDIGDSLHGHRHREPVYITIQSAFGTTACQYDKSATDSGCAGCQHINQGGV